MGRVCSTHGRDDNCIQNFGQKMKGRDHSEGMGIDGRLILEWILGKYLGKVWTGCILLRIGTSNKLL